MYFCNYVMFSVSTAYPVSCFLFCWWLRGFQVVAGKRRDGCGPNSRAKEDIGWTRESKTPTESCRIPIGSFSLSSFSFYFVLKIIRLQSAITISTFELTINNARWFERRWHIHYHRHFFNFDIFIFSAFWSVKDHCCVQEITPSISVVICKSAIDLTLQQKVYDVGSRTTSWVISFKSLWSLQRWSIHRFLGFPSGLDLSNQSLHLNKPRTFFPMFYFSLLALQQQSIFHNLPLFRWFYSIFFFLEA